MVIVLFAGMVWYGIRQKNLELHQRYIISSFTCVAYFVTIHIIDWFAMKFIEWIIPDKSIALIPSDAAAWLLPLICFWLYVGVRKIRQAV
ncbi:MAG: hypothetical protein KF687_16640 [Cyclobacteriaceae bacterium]|nr:hypothetical protein [Cyclobacteriaceae bacterium]